MDDTFKAIAEDAVALLNEWDRNLWDTPGSRYVRAPDLVDLDRRMKAIPAAQEWQDISTERLCSALDTALRQWRMYANCTEARDEFDLVSEKSAEADLYREGMAVLDSAYAALRARPPVAVIADERTK
jgi:hypothetical protein